MSAIGAVEERLAAHWKVLQQRWRATRERWDDAAARRFERDFWRVVEKALPETLDEMRKLDDVVVQARRDLR